ncbi:uncharacterized protein LOC141700377 [Apium graveolens]|uniref:uncharacterized protein LOC141700377 n=1 Tax=Apium graveolens TaxID=4045 RepID=UPI003D7B3F87
MKLPSSIKDVQKLTGRITDLRKFINKSGDKCIPFFKALKKVKDFAWTNESQTTFEELKKYMVQAPLLAQPVMNEILYIKVFSSLGYGLKKITFLLPSAQDRGIGKTTLMNIIHSPKNSGRLIKWSIELGEFDIKYKPITVIKVQDEADFMVECNIDNQEVRGQEDIPQGGMDNKEMRKKAEDKEFWLDFLTTNSEVEYEALIAGLGLARTLGVKNLKVFGDSKLVVSYVNGEFEARDETMAKYVRLIRLLMTQFDECHVEYIPKEENSKVDALTKFASSEVENSFGSVYFCSLKTRSIDIKLVAPIGLGGSWIDPIKAHLQIGWIPDDAMEARKLAIRALRYSLIDGILNKRSFVIPYLRCLRLDKARLALEEVHEGIYG